MKTTYTHNLKEYTLDEIYNNYSYWDYLEIQFNRLGKWKLYNKSWWEAIKFDWIDEFYWGNDFWDYIKIQFNEWEDLKKFYYKDINKKITIDLI